MEPGASAWLRRVVAAMAGDPDHPRAALVAPAGAGADDVVDHLARTLPEVIHLRGRRLEQERPLAALLDAVPALTGTDPASAGAGLVDAMGADGALVVTEAQWLDGSSAAAVAHVAERAAERRRAVVVAHRPTSGDLALAAIDAALGVVALPPLTEADVAERAARHLAAAVDDGLVDALAEQSAGYPAFVDGLLAGWAAAGLLDGGRLTAAADPAPAAVTAGVVARVGALSRPARLVLEAMGVGADDDDLRTTITGVAGGDLVAALAELRAEGLIQRDRDEIVPTVAAGREVWVAAADRRRIHAALATRFAERGVPARAAEHVLAAGERSSAAAPVLVGAAEALTLESPAQAVDLARLALDWGADEIDAGPVLAEAELAAGSVGSALAVADRVAHPPTADGRAASGSGARARALAVVAAAHLHDGHWRQAAAAFGAVRDHPRLPDRHFASLAEAAAWAAGTPPVPDPDGFDLTLAQPPPLETEAAQLVASGLALAIADGDAGDALANLVRAADLCEALPAAATVPPAHVAAAAVAGVAGDFDLAVSLLERAIRAEVGGPAATDRHRALLAWAYLRVGRWADSRAQLPAPSERLHPDGSTEPAADPPRPLTALIVAAVEAGLARRAGDLNSLDEVWRRADPLLARHQPGLLLVEPVLELVVAAARLGHEARTRPVVEALEHRIEALGTPAPWALAVRWGRLQAAVVSDRHDEVLERAAAVMAVQPPPARLAVLGAAADAWRVVLDGAPGPEGAVEDAAEGLAGAGLVWEASRLVGQAAIRHPDPGGARALLERARDLKARLPGDRGADDAPEPSVLSERELEVGRRVLDGLTHKEIGAALYISPKTVEHHVARIRQKLGAANRAEMVTALRAELA